MLNLSPFILTVNETNTGMEERIDITKGADYFKLLYKFRAKLLAEPCNLYSAIAYGSVCRLEMIPEYSDVDILVIINDESLSVDTSKLLDRVVSDLANLNIKIHLRIRNLYDLEHKTSGLFDCGVTSAINKLRDSIVLFGESLDQYYLAYLKSVTEEEILTNLYFRFSDLRYQNRALLSIKTGGQNPQLSDRYINYKAGCILTQLAEMICYSKGLLFENSHSAIINAGLLCDEKLFGLAESAKHGEMELDIARFVSRVDTIINNTVKSIDTLQLMDILKISIQDHHTAEDDDFIVKWKGVIWHTGFHPGSLIVKKADVQNGILTINRYCI